MPLSSITQQITFLYTRNLPATTNFYEQVLGFPLWLDQGDCRIYQVTGGGYIGFCQRQQTPEQPEGVILCLVTEDVDAWWKMLAGKGIEFEKPPQHNPNHNIYHCFVRDPNGYLIEIQRFEHT